MNDSNDLPVTVGEATAASTTAPPVSSASAVAETVQTGFPSLDNLLGGGARRGDLIILCGDVSVGKSSLALAIARRSADVGHRVIMLSGEMTLARLEERLAAIEERRSIDDLRRSVVDAMDHLPHPPTPLVLDELPYNGMVGVSDYLVPHLGIDLVIVDPLQYLAVGDRGLDEELAAVARSLKELALRRQTTILAVSQLARAVRERMDARPVLEDLGGKGAVAQQADIVLGLFREELYAPSVHTEGAAELHVLKNRNGPRGFVDLFFYKQWLRFEDMVEPDR